MILTGAAMLATNQQPSREQIVRGLENNFCRCGAHTRIIDAMQAAAAEMRGEKLETSKS
jgi:aerobic-type carbon monoxide dehydrogenase small subunit (CoxS/CutS family)